MQDSEKERDRVCSFVESWITRNINVGPFSCDDSGPYDGAIRQFTNDAAGAGLDAALLERVIGPVPEFMTNALAAAGRAWLAAAEVRRRARRAGA